MSPIPGWLVGAQSVALNMSNNDLAVQMHFSLFKDSGGYVLKPAEMWHSRDASEWPPWREQLHCAVITLISIHNLPKVCSFVRMPPPAESPTLRPREFCFVDTEWRSPPSLRRSPLRLPRLPPRAQWCGLSAQQPGAQLPGDHTVPSTDWRCPTLATIY